MDYTQVFGIYPQGYGESLKILSKCMPEEERSDFHAAEELKDGGGKRSKTRHKEKVILETLQ